MVNSKAIASIINRISEGNGAPCKKTLQKIVFLIEAKHVDLGCSYGIHFYGPYSSDLDYAIRQMSDEGIVSIEYTPMEHLISVTDKEYTRDYQNSTVDEVLNEFSNDTANELELLATALYVYLGFKEPSKIKPGVIKIKGNKYSDQRIDKAIERLKNAGYIVA